MHVSSLAEQGAPVGRHISRLFSFRLLTLQPFSTTNHSKDTKKSEPILDEVLESH
jgi:hypothetical protein